MKQVTNKEAATWEVASLTRITFARTFDLVISALPMLILQLFLKIDGWIGILINAFFALSLLIIYFIIIPCFISGNTIGKKVFQISIKSREKVGFKKIFFREGFFVLLPWLISFLIKVIALGIFYLGDHNNDDIMTNGFWIAFGIARFGDLFYLAWAAFMFITIKVQENNQSGIDLKYNIFVVKKNPIIEKAKDDGNDTKTNSRHIHLDENRPGEISDDIIREIEEID
ncbi:RDD family protein [Spiroplasma alleghenense]|uniref:RDD family protein n=1 Tax=Spiroplasma alleghenense TaxID=216931 RepID=A0A345Z2E8_9MOLU|nr:RDD family protein [Spiroplasma alleghenense]AXK50777.1 RDD family protein [Spiroplasma alleghenense]